MGTHGQGEVRVTHDNGDDDSPSFSPNGRRIAYSKDNLSSVGPDNPRRVSIFTIRTDGTGKRLLVQGGSVASPQYSPDGERVVFQGRPKGHTKWGLWTVRSHGSHLRRLTDPGKTRDYDETPDWSPDGRHIVFLRCDINTVHGCDGSVYRMRADGSYQRPVRLIAGEVAPAYAPSGGRLVLMTFKNDGDCSDLYKMSLAGVTQGYVTDNCDKPSEGRTATQPSWQPVVGPQAP
jgi:TolB protein